MTIRCINLILSYAGDLRTVVYLTGASVEANILIHNAGCACLVSRRHILRAMKNTAWLRRRRHTATSIKVNADPQVGLHMGKVYPISAFL